jgi:hypothetical protein
MPLNVWSSTEPNFSAFLSRVPAFRLALVCVIELELPNRSTIANLRSMSGRGCLDAEPQRQQAMSE